MDHDILKAEITADPLGVGYAAMSAEEAVAALNAKTRARPVSITSGELLAWSGQAGRFQRLDDAADNPALPGELRSVCKTARAMILRDGTTLDLTRPDRAAMLGALVASGVLTGDDAASLTALGQEKCSRAEELGLPTVGPHHVDYARSL